MLYIGAGGWAYFQVPGIDPLNAYSKAFNFVEVNSTFYLRPEIETVRSWRQRVPENFKFSVRCHRDMTHKYLLSPCHESLEILNYSLRICSELKAEILHIQTPPSFDPIEMMCDLGIIHCTDISCELPAVDSNILYSRLFGHGEHNLYQFDDSELLGIYK